jgi:hypothetical protein
MGGKKASTMRDFGKLLPRDMAGTKILSDGARHIPKKIMVPASDGNAVRQSGCCLAYIFGKYRKRAHTQTHGRRRGSKPISKRSSKGDPVMVHICRSSSKKGGRKVYGRLKRKRNVAYSHNFETERRLVAYGSVHDDKLAEEAG